MHRRLLEVFFVSVLFLTLVATVSAGQRHWAGSGSGNGRFWDRAANWSVTQGGAGGAGVAEAADDAFNDGGGALQVNTNAVCLSFTQSSALGTKDFINNATLTVGAGDWPFSAASSEAPHRAMSSLLPVTGPRTAVRSLRADADDTATPRAQNVGSGTVTTAPFGLTAGSKVSKWTEFGFGLPNAIVSDLRYTPARRYGTQDTGDVLVVATMGRGVYKLTGVSNLATTTILQITGVVGAAHNFELRVLPNQTGFMDVLVDSVPVSGGPFQLSSFDR